MTDHPPANWDLIGHQRAIERLERAIARGVVAHAFLLAGPPKVGKSTLATALAARLLCESPEAPCGVCRTCQQVKAGVFPDLTRIEPQTDASTDDGEGGRRRSITIAQVREAQRQAYLSPYQAARRVFVCLDIETMQGPAADALLKTLEEPPPRATFVLTTRDPAVTPATIVSRCQVIPLRLVPEAEIAAGLRARGVAANDALNLARLSGGRPGWAITAATKPDAARQAQAQLTDWINLMPANTATRFEFAQNLERLWKADRAGFDESLDIWLRWWRDLLLTRTGCDDLVVNVDHRDVLARHAKDLSVERIVEYVGAVIATARGLDQNAQPRLALEAMLVAAPTQPSTGVGRRP